MEFGAYLNRDDCMMFFLFLKRWWRKTLGVLLIIGGIAGLFLPFLQGIAMILAGLALLGNKKAIAAIARLKAYWRRWKRPSIK